MGVTRIISDFANLADLHLFVASLDRSNYGYDEYFT
jgi:hypothetical protein